MISINHKGVLATAMLLGLSASVLHAERGDVVFAETFDTEDDFARWEVVDLNGGRAWEYLNGTAAYMLDWQTFLPGDDWLISPAFQLKPNTAYEIRFYMNVLSKVESMRMALADSHDPSVLAQHVLSEYDHVTSLDKGEKEVRICTDANGGAYYLGFYAYSDPDQHRIEVDNVRITDLGPSSIPADVTNLTGEAGASGALSATICFTAPDKAANGETLSDLTAIDIYRGNDLTTPVHSIAHPEAGQELSWTDNNAQQGYNHYSVVARNDDGESQPAVIDIYVGADTPTAIARVSAKVESDLSVTVKWDAPTTSVHGGYVDYSGIRYKVKRNNKTIYTDLADTWFNDPTPGTNEKQGQVKYTITPVAGTMTGESTVSLNVVTGQPLEMPYIETFADRQMVAPWYLDEDACDFEWKRSADSEDDYAISSHDRDNGFLLAESTYGDRGQQSRYVSPILNVSTLEQPVLTFWFYEGRDPWYDPEFQGSVYDRLQVQWRRVGGEWQDLQDATFYQNASTMGWVKCEVLLPRVDDAYINLGLLAIADAEHYAYRDIAIDDISLLEAGYSHDVRMDHLLAEQLRVTVGEEMHLSATLSNCSSHTEHVNVTLLREGTPYAEAEAELAPLARVIVPFSYTASYEDANKDSITWVASLSCTGDEVANDTSTPLCTSVRHADVPVIEELTAQMQDQQTVTLRWRAATSVSDEVWDEPLTVTDGFEDYEDFAIDGIGAWTLYDGDRATTLNTGRIPLDYPHKGEPMSFQVFNPEVAGVWCEGNYDGAFEPMDDAGKYLMCASTDYPYENDDWLITPRLDGRAHKVSFNANAATYDAEWIEVLYSLTDNHHDSFLPIPGTGTCYVHEGWRLHEFEVPEGTQYFALRCIRRSVFLMVDNFTYNAWNGHEPCRALRGYNIYRNGVRLNDAPLELSDEDGWASCSDVVPAEGVYTYQVTAVYDLGESLLSQQASIDTSSALPAIEQEPEAHTSAVYDLYGRRALRASAGTILITNGHRILLKP